MSQVGIVKAMLILIFIIFIIFILLIFSFSLSGYIAINDEEDTAFTERNINTLTILNVLAVGLTIIALILIYFTYSSVVDDELLLEINNSKMESAINEKNEKIEQLRKIVKKVKK